MIVFVDDEQRIKAVGSTHDESLTPLEINDNAEDNPFLEWSTAKICAYRCTVNDGVVTMMTPYVASSALDYIDEVGKKADDNEDKAQAFDIMIGGAE